MKKNVNGISIEMTTEEIAEMQKAQTEAERVETMQPPTPEERLEALEMAMLELAEVLANG